MLREDDDDPGTGGGRLVVVATPIGNLEDLSPRAARVLAEADLVLAEDTRRTGRLLAHLGSGVAQQSLHDHNEAQRVPAVLARIAAGATVALVSDAGTPTVSDPGYRLIRACVDAGVLVEAVPGPSAVLHALVVSGLATDRFAFEGFLPRRGAARRQRLAELASEPRTLVVFVPPHRAGDDLRDLAATLGEERQAALCRELTKLHEEVRRGGLGALAGEVEARAPRGEITLVVEGAPKAAAAPPTDAALVAAVAERVARGASKKEAIAAVAAATGAPKRGVYQAVVDSGLGDSGGA